MRTGTTTAAAEQLRISQPAISRLVRDFEASVALRLFNRKGNRLRPTPAAFLLFRETQRWFENFQHIFQCAANIRNGVAGSLRIVVMPALAIQYLSQPITELVKANPGLLVSIHCELSQNIPPLIASGQFDIGIGSIPLGAPLARLEPLPTLNSACVMPKQHPLTKSRVIKLHDLCNVSLLTVAGSSLLRTRVEVAMASVGLQANIRVESTMSMALVALVQQGLGVAIVDPFTALECSNAGLAVRPLRPAIPYELAILLPTSNPRNDTANAFLASFKKYLERDFKVKCGSVASESV
jgi:DNA-binding transcriptional LysR family regulator